MKMEKINREIGHNFVKMRLRKCNYAEQSLWRAVVCQIIEDALITSNNSRKQCFKRRAIEWLNLDNEDFSLICEMAGIKQKMLLDYLGKVI